MKKTFVKAAAAILVASALFFVGCSNGTGDSFDVQFGDRSDDAVSILDTPKVTAFSYPGVVMATFTSVASAQDYEVQVTFEKGESVTELVSNASEIDVDGNTVYITPFYFGVTDGQKVTIRVSAVSKSDPARKVTVYSSKYGEDSAKLIIPPTGTHALQLAAYEDGYDGSVKTTKDVLDAEKIKVVKNDNDVYVNFPAKVYLSYDIYLAKDYEQTQDLGSNKSNKLRSSVNNGSIGTSLTITEAGNYTVVANVSGGNAYITDRVVGETVTYETLIPSSAAISQNVSYVESTVPADVARLSWTPATYNNAPAPTSFYKIYRRVKTENDLSEVTAEIKVAETYINNSAIKSVRYYLDDTIPDPSKSYEYVIVLTNEGKFAASCARTTLYAKNYVYAVAPSIYSNYQTVANVADADDGLQNDIVWTVNVNNKYQTLKAYLLSKDEDYNVTPVYGDFDLSAPLEAKTYSNDTTYTIVTKDVAVGKAYLLAVVSEEGKLDNYTISSAVTIDDYTVALDTNANLQVQVYDNTVTNVNDDASLIPAQVNNDVLITFTDYIDPTTDKIDNYTYKLYKTTTESAKSVYNSKTYTLMLGDWTEVEGFSMALDTVDLHNSAKYKYLGIVKLADVADGSYAYKVVKSRGNKFVTSNVVVSSVNTSTSTALSYYLSAGKSVAQAVKLDTDGKTWVTADVSHLSTQTNRVTMTVSAKAIAYIYGTGYLESYPVGIKNNLATVNSDVVYNVYRTEKKSGQYAAVYTLVGTMTRNSEATVKGTYTTYKLDGDGKTAVTDKVDVEYDASYEYNFVDSGVTTGLDYEYIVVATKADYADYVF